MTLHVTINPADFDATYLDSLNVCFGGWGDDALYEWAFQRAAGSYLPDQMIIRDDAGELLAGSAVSYRKVTDGSRCFHVGIMTGSWTLPAARGQGCFTRIIEESRLLSEGHGCGLLLAFVTWDNGSRRRLEEAGSRMIPSRYVFTSDDQTAMAKLDVTPSEDSLEAVWQAVERSRGDALHFVYPELRDFVSQCVARAHPVDVLEVGSAQVLVERAGNTDRVCVAALGDESLEDVFESVAAAAHKDGRRFFGFAIGEHSFDNLATKEGFLTALVADEQALDGASLDELSRWAIDSGDRM